MLVVKADVDGGMLLWRCAADLPLLIMNWAVVH